MRHTVLNVLRQGCLLFMGVLTVVGCSGRDDVRMEVSGTVSLQGQPVPSGTLVLTPKEPTAMPTASRVEAGRFAFDTQTGPRPGEYVARINPDEASIEEITEAAEQNPREAAGQFNVNRAGSRGGVAAAMAQAVVVISDAPGQTLDIELK